MVTGVLDGKIFLTAMTLTNKINIFAIIDWKDMFLFPS